MLHFLSPGRALVASHVVQVIFTVFWPAGYLKIMP
jgi:hypothetical protein